MTASTTLSSKPAQPIFALLQSSHVAKVPVYQGRDLARMCVVRQAADVARNTLRCSSSSCHSFEAHSLFSPRSSRSIAALKANQDKDKFPR
eukprot:scaffold278524_cov13-Tisochrysis_lutea.AAC.1